MTEPRPRGEAPAAGPADSAHYSYAVYADPEMAQRFDALRFGGPIGSLVAEGQERVLVDFLGDVRNASVLDVGTGTGRAAIVLAARGAHVTGIDASAEMLAVARARARSAGVGVEFATGDAHQLQFPDKSFDAAVSLRVLMHTPDWQQCVAELCRVTRRAIVVDYPSRRSVAWLQSTWRRARQRAGAAVEAYRVFSPAEVQHAFRSHGFRVTRVDRQFVLPIALHKAIGSRRVTTLTERALRSVGLLFLFGSPVTVLAVREDGRA